ncbi:hypothetical protein [Paenibacillus agricola]|uniref:Uncharacterized protein n=1 Tax=Paenibacillus agricola TaxID=2716264 RepID=A0ABX0J2Y6_9BACL|nr:hypothetical protein [Paenibacillus agricola]NHN30727.1 hypothetical protein [Paenibacillus agricola]
MITIQLRGSVQVAAGSSTNDLQLALLGHSKVPVYIAPLYGVGLSLINKLGVFP